MIFLAVACALSALAHLMLVVPRLPEPVLADGEEPPDYGSLATWRAAVGVTLATLIASVLALPAQQPWHLLPWFGYLGAGAALVWVDLRTTWLPRRLNTVVLVQVLAGLAVLAAFEWHAVLGALIGGVSAYLLFYLVWRLGAGLGFGDVRLAGIIGLVSGSGGLQLWGWSLMLGTLIGAAWAIVHWFTTRHKGRLPFPYGPSLWLGPIVAAALIR